MSAEELNEAERKEQERAANERAECLAKIAMLPPTTMQFLRSLFHEVVMTREEWQERNEKWNRWTKEMQEDMPHEKFVGGIPPTLEDQLYHALVMRRRGLKMEVFASSLPDGLGEAFAQAVWEAVG